MDSHNTLATGVSNRISADSAASTSFQWTPLNYRRREVRLLELHSIVPGEEEDQLINVSMHTAPLNECPAYYALSYCWGPRECARNIMIDGHPHPVTNNLYEALTALRGRQVPHLWVDALCINQDDPDEKGAQVQRMATIFQEAQKVVAWLGPARDDTGTMFASLRELANSQRTPTCWEAPFQFRAKPSSLLTFGDVLFGRYSWSRILDQTLVVQELAVATQVELFCGAHSLDGRVFELLFSSHGWAEKQLDAEKRWTFESFEHFERVVNIWSVREQVRQRKPLDLLNLLSSLRRCITTEILDRDYAISGLAYDQRSFVAEPDYTLSAARLDFTMTRRLMESTASLDILVLSVSSGTGSLHSWHSAFSAIDTERYVYTSQLQAVIDYVNGKRRVLRCGVHGPTWLTTEPRLIEKLPFLISDDVLTVKGLRLGRAYNLREKITSPTVSDNAPQDLDWFTSLCRMLLMTSAFYNAVDCRCARRLKNKLLFGLRNAVHGRRVHGVDGLNAAERRMAKFLSVRGIDGSNAAERIMAEFLDVCGKEAIFAALYPPDQQHAERPPVAFQPKPDLGSDTEVRRHAIQSAIELGKEYHTYDAFAMDAHSIGMAAGLGGSTRQTDEIWLLNRCSMPLILQPVSGTSSQYRLVNYAIIDTAVVDGKRCNVMDGEAWRTARTEDFQYVELV